MKFKKLLSKLDFRTIAVFLVSSISASLLCLGTSKFRTDKFVNDLFSYNTHSSYSIDDCPILHFSTLEGKSNDSLLRTFYYNNQVYSARSMTENSNKIVLDDASIDFSLFSQPAFYARELPEENGGYYLDFGLYYAYFNSDFLGGNNFITNRFGADGFIVLSDTVADKLLDAYGISSYEELIKNEKYALIDVSVDDVTTLKFSINNIVYSTFRDAPRTYDLYGDFALTYMNPTLSKVYTQSFELDLKQNAFCIKSVLTTLEYSGYTPDTTSMYFKSLNSSGEYETNIELSNEFVKSQNRSSDVVCLLLYFVILAGGLFFTLWINNKKKYRMHSIRLSFAVKGLFFVIYCFVVNFIYTYSLISIAPLVLLLGECIFNWKEVFGNVSRENIRFDEKNHDDDKDLYSIEI